MYSVRAHTWAGPGPSARIISLLQLVYEFLSGHLFDDVNILTYQRYMVDAHIYKIKIQFFLVSL